MEVYELLDQQNNIKKYQAFNIVPTPNCLIRVFPQLPEVHPYNKNRINMFLNLSEDRIYEVYRITNVNQVLVFDDKNQPVHLYPSQYQVVEEISDKELSLLMEKNEMLKVIDNMIKKNRSNY